MRHWPKTIATVFLLIMTDGAALAQQSATDAVVEDEVEKKVEEAVEALADDRKPPASAEVSDSEVDAVDPDGQAALDDSLTCLARTLYWEARGTGDEGMSAVAHAVINVSGTMISRPRSVKLCARDRKAAPASSHGGATARATMSRTAKSTIM
ncbi:MAG: hypothetical protein R3C97_16510 [Geminicoccaceae bacterium]